MYFYTLITILLLSAIFCRNKKMFKLIYTINTAVLLFLLFVIIDCFYDFYIKPDIGSLFIVPWVMGLFILFSILRACMKISAGDKVIPFLSIGSIFIWSIDAISGNGIVRVMGDGLIGIVSSIAMIYFYVKTIKI